MSEENIAKPFIAHTGPTGEPCGRDEWLGNGLFRHREVVVKETRLLFYQLGTDISTSDRLLVVLSNYNIKPAAGPCLLLEMVTAVRLQDPSC